MRQPVALKVFEPGTCTEKDWETRLQSGADLWVAVAQAKIVPVHRSGWWNGAAFLAMEYVAQGSLRDKLAVKPMPLRQSLVIVEQLAETVSYLHRQGIVHGNLKATNVLLGADETPRLADFRLTGGLFQCPVPADDVDPCGLGYLAPEVIQEPDGEFRPYTDIYGLGLILYELLTNQAPFDGTTAREVRKQVISCDPALPSRFNSKVTPALDALCLRCLRKNHWSRYARAYDVATRLRQFINHLSDSSDPERLPPPRSHPLGRRK
jgi:serine/threonine protein kinase